MRISTPGQLEPEARDAAREGPIFPLGEGAARRWLMSIKDKAPNALRDPQERSVRLKKDQSTSRRD